jgi:5-dehydro-4-deoxyglucarate dehydratase
MPSTTTPDELKAIVPTGLLSFPVTDFDAAGGFDADGYRRRLEWLGSYPAAALFVAGGTGEFFSLTAQEYSSVVATAVAACRDRVPIIAGTGFGTRTAIEYAQQAERLGAAGLLLLPPYLTETSQGGLRAHIAAVCKATQLGVIVYNRANCRISADTLQQVADECPNLIGFKDGVGDIESMVSIANALGNRLTYLGGLPTAEVYAQAYMAMGVATYSSAVFNFIPRTALAFHRAATQHDNVAVASLLRTFFLPYLRIRNRQPGYAVSIVKAGAAIVGRAAGPVRPPIQDLDEDERAGLAVLIEALGPQ